MKTGLLSAALALVAATVPAAADEGAIWLAISVPTTDPALAAEAAALAEGRRPGLVANAGYDRRYPVPGFVPVAPDVLRRGIGLAPGSGQPPVLMLRRMEDGAFVLLDRQDVVVAAPEPMGEVPVLALRVPFELVRPALAAEKADGSDAALRWRAMVFAPPLRIASAGDNLGRAMRSHEAGVRRRQAAPLGGPQLVFEPGRGLVPDRAHPPAMLPVGLGTDLGARWLFTSTPPGATVAFEGLGGPVATEVGVRNLPASVMRTMVMRKEGFRDCRHGDARLDVVVRAGLEWNSVHCRLAAVGD